MAAGLNSANAAATSAMDSEGRMHSWDRTGTYLGSKDMAAHSKVALGAPAADQKMAIKNFPYHGPKTDKHHYVSTHMGAALVHEDDVAANRPESTVKGYLGKGMGSCDYPYHGC